MLKLGLNAVQSLKRKSPLNWRTSRNSVMLQRPASIISPSLHAEFVGHGYGSLRIGSVRTKFSDNFSKKYDMLCMDNAGNSLIQKTTLAGLKSELHLHARDMLSLVMHLDDTQQYHAQLETLGIAPSASQRPMKKRLPYFILPRPTCILAAFGPIKVVILADCVYVFDPQAPLVQEWTSKLQHMSKAPARQGQQHQQAFELFVLEFLLNECCDSFDRRIRLCSSLMNDILYRNQLGPAAGGNNSNIQTQTHAFGKSAACAGGAGGAGGTEVTESRAVKVLQRLQERVASLGGGVGGAGGDSAEAIYKLAPMRDMLYEFLLEIEEARKCLVDILHDDEDTYSLMLTHRRQYQPSDDTGDSCYLVGHEEAELLLESYTLRLSQSHNSILFLQQRVDSQQKLTDLRMQLRRNRLLSLNVYLASTAVCIAAVSAVTSGFGMNLHSGLEDTPHLFYAVTGVTGALGLVLYAQIKRYIQGDAVYHAAEQRELQERLLLERIFTNMPVVDLAVKSAIRKIRLGSEEGPSEGGTAGSCGGGGGGVRGGGSGGSSGSGGGGGGGVQGKRDGIGSRDGTAAAAIAAVSAMVDSITAPVKAEEQSEEEGQVAMTQEEFGELYATLKGVRARSPLAATAATAVDNAAALQSNGVDTAGAPIGAEGLEGLEARYGSELLREVDIVFRLLDMDGDGLIRHSEAARLRRRMKQGRPLHGPPSSATPLSSTQPSVDAAVERSSSSSSFSPQGMHRDDTGGTR